MNEDKSTINVVLILSFVFFLIKSFIHSFVYLFFNFGRFSPLKLENKISRNYNVQRKTSRPPFSLSHNPILKRD